MWLATAVVVACRHLSTVRGMLLFSVADTQLHIEFFPFSLMLHCIYSRPNAFGDQSPEVLSIGFLGNEAYHM